jgi:hypothetical protein
MRASRWTYLGLFLTTLATVMFEILLTRIFSVTLWYHFAFMAISIAMFGMTCGALIVYLRPASFPNERLSDVLGRQGMRFALTMSAAVVAHLLTPFDRVETQPVLLALNFFAITVPFVFSGICVALALTRYPQDISTLYAADLIGAALACIVLVAVMNTVDGISAVFITGVLAALGALAFAWKGVSRVRRMAAVVASVLALGAAGNAVAVSEGRGIRIQWAKGYRLARVEHERWNAFSRLAVVKASPATVGWSMSRNFQADRRPEHYWLLIDSWAGTLITEFDGDLSKVNHLKYDVTNFVHYLKRDASVLVIGSGGGRDLLSALVFGQRPVTGVELNHAILDITRNRYGEFGGRVYDHPDVRVVNDEGRSFVARSDEPVDILQLTFIDTWAATAAGAFVLTENSLYTAEAWTLFLRRLKDDGILTVSRNVRDRAPMYRLVSMGREALLRIGAARPEDHLVVVANQASDAANPWADMGALMVKRTPWTAGEIAAIVERAASLDFDVLLRPHSVGEPEMAALADGSGRSPLEARLGLDLSPPTDDRPFFFNMLHLADLAFGRGRHEDPNLRAVSILWNLLITVTVGVVICIGVPLAATADRRLMRRSANVIGFFGLIGLGFMLVEISLLQRLIVFLGHPTYALTVILFVLLLAGGAGSAITSRVSDGGLARTGIWLLLALNVTLLVAVFLASRLVRWFGGETTPLRIVIATAVLAPLGLLMGMAFPLGMRLANRSAAALTPFLWGINGAMSIYASVLATALSLELGIGATMMGGALAYGCAAGLFARAARRENQAGGSPVLSSCRAP